MKSAVSIQGDEANISQEAGYGALLVIVGFKDAVEICRLNDLVWLVGEIEQFEVPTPIGHRRVGTHEFSNPGAVHFADTLSIQQDVPDARVHQFSNLVMEFPTPLPEGHLSLKVQNRHP